MFSRATVRVSMVAAAAAGAVVALGAAPAMASFHIMQIEQVIAGVNGDTSAQAIQLRMRTSFQNLVNNGRLVAYDAHGQNPVVLIAFDHAVNGFNQGDRVLVVSPGFGSHSTPGMAADFVMTNPIPASYMAAGRITFEDNFGTIYWSVAFGGSSYTGSNLGSITNDADGNFGPPIAGPMPTATLQAARFLGVATAPSTNNLADYALTAGAAVLTNNAGQSFTISVPPPACPADFDHDGSVTPADIAGFVNLWFTSLQNGTLAGDFDGNGNTEPADIAAFVNAWFTTLSAGGC